MSEHKKRSPLEIAEAWTLPLVVALCAILSTRSITKAQLESSERIAQATIENENSRARSAEQVKVLEIFSDQIKSEKPEKRRLALQVLTALEPDLALRLAQAVASTDTDQTTREAAADVVHTFTSKGNYFVVLGSYQSLDEAKHKLDALIKRKGAFPYPPEIYLSDNQWYALTLGGDLSSMEANQRLSAAKAISGDAYVRMTAKWGRNLLQ